MSKIGEKAITPNPALKPLEILVGTWSSTGSHGLFPDLKISGRASFEWIEGGAYLMMRSEADDPRFPSGMAIFGSDDVQKKFFMLYFDSRGVSRFYQVEVDGNVVKWHRDQPDFSQRVTNTVSADRKSIESRGELCRDGTTWEKDLDLDYMKEDLDESSLRS